MFPCRKVRGTESFNRRSRSRSPIRSTSTGEYPFSDLFLFVDLEGPRGRALRDTVECLLADPTGRWYGKGLGFIFADRYQAHVLYKLNNRFPASGRYSIKLEQAMRTEVLEGVLDVGVSVERSKR